MTDPAGFDDRLRRSLHDTAASAERRASAPPVSQVHRRARDRRHGMAAGLTFAVVAILGGGTVLVTGAFGDDGNSVANAPSQSPSESVTTAPTTPPTPPPPTSGATEIPDDFTLPDELAYGMETAEEVLTADWPANVCGNVSYRGDTGRTDFRSVSASGLESDYTNALAVYGLAETAVEVVADMRIGVESCLNHELPSGFTESWEIRPMGIGGESFIAASTMTTPEGDSASGGQLFAVTRVGNAIYVTYQFADGRPSVDNNQAAEVEAALADFAPRMCVFTVAGC